MAPAQQGPVFHWKLDLFQQLNLPVYDGVRESLERLNHRRKKALDQIKTTRARKRRVQLKTLRSQEAQQRKLWSKQHGQDTYGDEEELTDEEGAVESSKGNKKEKTAKKPCNRCGSKTHSRSTHRDCPYNKKNKPAKTQPQSQANHPPHTLPMNQARAMTVVQ